MREKKVFHSNFFLKITSTDDRHNLYSASEFIGHHFRNHNAVCALNLFGYFYHGVKNIGRWVQQQDGGKSWRHLVSAVNALTSQASIYKKTNGIQTTIVTTHTILKLISWDFLMTSTILLLKLLMSCNNLLKVTVLSLWRSKDRKNRFVINEIYKLISVKSLILRFRHRSFMLSLNCAVLK